MRKGRVGESNEFIYEYKYDNVEVVRDFVLRKFRVDERLNELKVRIVNDFLVHYMLSLLTVHFS